MQVRQICSCCKIDKIYDMITTAKVFCRPMRFEKLEHVLNPRWLVATRAPVKDQHSAVICHVFSSLAMFLLNNNIYTSQWPVGLKRLLRWSSYRRPGPSKPPRYPVGVGIPQISSYQAMPRHHGCRIHKSVTCCCHHFAQFAVCAGLPYLHLQWRTRGSNETNQTWTWEPPLKWRTFYDDIFFTFKFVAGWWR